jgi:hypothetical protein
MTTPYAWIISKPTWECFSIEQPWTCPELPCDMAFVETGGYRRRFFLRATLHGYAGPTKMQT